MILNKECYLSIEQIKGKLEVIGYDDNDCVEIQIEMCKVFDW